MNNQQLHDDPLFRAAQERLSDLEVPYNGADWDAMNRRLDAQPKSSSFRWRYSLNGLAIALAMGGLAYGAYYWATKPASPQTANPIVKTQTLPITQTDNQTPVLPVSTNSLSTLALSGDPGMASLIEQQVKPTLNADAKVPSSTKEELTALLPTKPSRVKPKGGLLFGDQIDPRHGFVKQTSEDDSLIEESKKLGKPNVPFYDANDKGEVKRVDLSLDSSGLKGELKDKNQPQNTSDSMPNPPQWQQMYDSED
ncbi:MAG: hypothetical protein ACRCYO_07515 [Bacteroidia bacterium]